MLIARYQSPAGPAYGLVVDGYIQPLEGDVFGSFAPSGARLPLSTVSLLAPVSPSKVVAIGLNYLDHVHEHGNRPPDEPVIFLKSPGSVAAPGEHIVLPPNGHRIDYEGELALIIGRQARHVPPDRAYDYILGCTCSADISDRDLQRRDGQWARAKSFDTFTPLGPWIAVGLGYDDLHITTRLNGQVRQDSRTSNMLFDVGTLIHVISSCMTLYPGDVIMTGTPAGVGPLCPGDVLEITVEGVGTLKNPVVLGPA
jgi:2-keto-4-pentenoate hydratase/2-oxohepta-3-ene-1,7-dioic acid hydratase in catechol pathway